MGDRPYFMQENTTDCDDPAGHMFDVLTRLRDRLDGTVHVTADGTNHINPGVFTELQGLDGAVDRAKEPRPSELVPITPENIDKVKANGWRCEKCGKRPKAGEDWRWTQDAVWHDGDCQASWWSRLLSWLWAALPWNRRKP